MEVTVTLSENAPVITISGLSSVAEALAAIDELAGRRTAGGKTVTVVDAPPGERRKTRGKKAEAAPPENNPPVVEESAPPGEEVPAVEPQGASEESAKEAIHAYANAFGIPAAKALLQEFGVARTSELTDPLKRYELIVRVSKELK